MPPTPKKPDPKATPPAKPGKPADAAPATPDAPPDEPVKQRATDTPDTSGSINDGYYDLAPGEEAFTPEQMIPDRVPDSADFAPTAEEYAQPPGWGYAKEGDEDPDSPKAQMRRQLIEQNKHMYPDLQ